MKIHCWKYDFYLYELQYALHVLPPSCVALYDIFTANVKLPDLIPAAGLDTRFITQYCLARSTRSGPVSTLYLIVGFVFIVSYD